jgi:uncharacterized protein YijF (DUF1287 family)
VYSDAITTAKKWAGLAGPGAWTNFSALCMLTTCFCVVAQTGISGSRANQKFLNELASAAVERTHHSVRYVSSYVSIPYPGGDVPADTGVCTDEIIRSYRAVGIDLQKEVHEDMVRDFDAYPHRHQRRPDSNIDHRRVPNLMVFFGRNGTGLSMTRDPRNYSPGDIVAWDLGGGVTHIGIVVDHKGSSGSYLVVHNIGRGPQMEDVLFSWKIIGHYRYFGPRTN